MREVAHQSYLLTFAIDDVDGAVVHAVSLHVLILRFSKCCHLSLERHLAGLNVAETLDDVHLPLAVECHGTVLVTADELNLEGQFLFLNDGSFL